MPITLPWVETDDLLRVITENSIHGVIIGNLHKDYTVIDHSERPSVYRGGVSGKPCFDVSNTLIKRTVEKYSDKLTIIGCGGVFTPQDAKHKFVIGSQLIHMITGMIYEGPGIIKKICAEI
jgi:dihydroorotate dehydrogenase